MLYSDCQVVLGVLPIGTFENTLDAQVQFLSPDENPAVLSGTNFDASRQSGDVMMAPEDCTFSLVHHPDHVVMIAPDDGPYPPDPRAHPVVMMFPGDAPYPPDPRAHLTFTMVPEGGTFSLVHHTEHVVMMFPGDGPQPPPDPK